MLTFGGKAVISSGLFFFFISGKYLLVTKQIPEQDSPNKVYATIRLIQICIAVKVTPRIYEMNYFFFLRAKALKSMIGAERPALKILLSTDPWKDSSDYNVISGSSTFVLDDCEPIFSHSFSDRVTLTSFILA